MELEKKLLELGFKSYDTFLEYNLTIGSELIIQITYWVKTKTTTVQFSDTIGYQGCLTTKPNSQLAKIKTILKAVDLLQIASI